MKRLILSVALCLIVLTGCEKEKTIGSYGDTRQEKGTPRYTMFYIKNMPCVWIKESEYRLGFGGLSCDWSRWSGE